MQVNRNRLAESKPPLAIDNLAGLDEKYAIHSTYSPARGYEQRAFTIELTWREILKIVGPGLRTASNSSSVDSALRRYAKDVLKKSFYEIHFPMTEKELILNQLELLGFLKSSIYNLKNGGQGVFYKLTPIGVSETLRLNAITSGV